VLSDPTALEGCRVLLIDDLDLVLARCPADHAPELADLVARLLRDGPAHGIRVVAAARRLAGAVHALAPLFGARLLLRFGSREDHVLAGAPGETFDPRAHPGAGTWDGAAVQVALPSPRERSWVAVPPPTPVAVPERGELAVVAARPRDLADRWDPQQVRVHWVGEHGVGEHGVGEHRVGEPDAGVPIVDPGRSVLLGDPDAWQSDWATLARARRDLPIVFHGCSVADVRAIARTREVPPLLAPREVWLVENGRIRRAVLVDGP